MLLERIHVFSLPTLFPKNKAFIFSSDCNGVVLNYFTFGVSLSWQCMSILFVPSIFTCKRSSHCLGQKWGLPRNLPYSLFKINLMSPKVHAYSKRVHLEVVLHHLSSTRKTLYPLSLVLLCAPQSRNLDISFIPLRELTPFIEAIVLRLLSRS